MKDAFAPGPLDESYVVSRTHFRYCVEGHHRLDLWTAEFSGWYRGQCECVRVSGTVFPSSFLVLLFL